MTDDVTPTNHLLALPKLRDDGANWIDYESKVRTAMGSRGLIRHVEGTARRPVEFAVENDVPVSSPGTPATEEEIETKEKKLDEFDQKEYTARHIILTSVSPRLATQLKAKTAKEMWNTVKSDATTKSKMHQVATKRRLTEARCAEEADVKDHLTMMVRVRDELESMGASVGDDEFLTHIIGSIPKSYHTLISSIMHSATLSKAAIDPNDLMKIILEEAERRSIGNNGADQSGSALYADRKRQRKKKGGDSQSDAKCYNCDKPGHTKAECYSKGGGKEGQAPWQKKKKSKEKGTANVATAPEKTEDDHLLYAFKCTSDFVDTVKREGGDASSIEAIMDSGADAHFGPERSRFENFVETPPIPISAADGRTFYAKGRGDVRINIPNGNKVTPITLKDVRYAPDMAFTLISVSRMDRARYHANFGDGMCKLIAPDQKVIGQIPLSGSLYRVDAKGRHPLHANAVVKKLSLYEAHRALGHISYGAVKHAIKSGQLTGIALEEGSEEVFCEACAQAKPERKPFPDKAKNRATKFGERIHMDLWGPASVESIGGKLYSIDFNDDATRWAEIDFLAQKNDAQLAYERFEKKIATHDDAKIKHLRSDWGTEFKNKAFDKHLASMGTKRELTVHDTHEQVGVAERMNRTKVELARAMLLDANLPKYLWAEAMHHAMWIRNRAPCRALDGKTPFEARHGRKPDMSGIIPFGTKAWVKMVNAGKLEARSEPGYFVGYDDQSTGYRIYFPDKRTVKPEREVVFDWQRQPNTITIPAEVQSVGERRKDTLNTRLMPDNDPNEPQNTSDEDPITPAQTPIRTRVSTKAVTDDAQDPLPPRVRPRPGYYRALDGRRTANLALDGRDNDWEPLYCLAAVGGTEPKTLAEARSGPHAEEWERAWKEEINQLVRRRTWILVDRPNDKPVIPCRPIFKEKLGPDGDVAKRKVRLVAGGHKQTKGVDYDETFAAAAKMASIRAVLAHAATLDWEIHQIDVVGAYLNAKLEEDIYMEPPEGLLHPDDGDKVCNLLLGLYGLKQAGRTWQKKMTRDFVDMGFEVSRVDASVFVRKRGDEMMVVPVSTDDMTVAGSSLDAVEGFKEEVRGKFEITDLGEMRWLLGFEVTRDRPGRTIAINQRLYIETIAARFNLTDAKPTYSPMEPNIALSKEQCPVQPITAPYQEACGSALWAAVISRPDVQFAVGVLARFTQNPGEVHWEAIKRVIRYLYTTRDLWLVMGGHDKTVEGYADADWGSQLDRHSISGYVFRYGCGAINWSSKRQPIVTLSSTEAEYVAAAHAAKEICWLRTFLGEIGRDISNPIKFRCDNQSTIALCRDNKFHARTKHIDIRYHFVREAVEAGQVDVHYIPTDENISDILTKPLSRFKLEYFVKLLGLQFV
jgi:hypothetical protein